MANVSGDDIRKNNGKEGLPAYVSVDGKAYDVSGSGLWSGGEHMGKHHAGADLSEDIKDAPHGKEVLERVKLLGEVAGDKPAASPTTSAPAVPAWAKTILGFHPHPIIVHFPQATFTLAPLFLLLFYATKNQSFERTALYLLICGVLTAAPAYLTGLFHWVYKYMRVPGKLYMTKLIVGQVLMVLSLITLYAHFSAGLLPSSPVNTIVTALYCILLPVAGTLGHVGGAIVFGPHKKG